MRSQVGEGIARWLLVAAFGLIAVVYAAAPVLAMRWAARPFAGFVVEQTLVVADYSGQRWGGSITGLHHPQQITHVADRPVTSPAEISDLTVAQRPGAWLPVRTRLPDGSTRIHLTTIHPRFPGRDLLRLFWLPYGVGLVYVAIAAWVYARQRDTAAGRSFVFFCLVTSLVNGLFFDLFTTHIATAVWTVAIAAEGATLINLSMAIPWPWPALARRRWLYLLPFAPSAALAVWGILVLTKLSEPWAYVVAWRASYGYAALGIVTLIGVMGYRERTSATGVTRQQARVIFVGSLLAFSPVAVWLAAPYLGLSLRFETVVFLPWLLLFPMSITLAIARYRLWDLDVIANRTLVYGGLTTTLAITYLVSVVVLQRLFEQWTGQSSSLAVAISTLGTAVLFNPLRRRIQDFIDRRFYRQKYDAARTLSAFGAQLREKIDLPHLAGELTSAVQQTLGPAYVLAWLRAEHGFSLAPDADGTDSVNMDDIAGRSPHTDLSAQFSVTPRKAERTSVTQPRSLAIPSTALEVAHTDPLIDQLRGAAGPLGPGRLNVASPALDRIKEADVQLLVPLVCQAELVGWLGLGPRLGGQPYTADDRALLANLAAQAGPAVRVAQLASERRLEALARQRLDYELRLAQRIQQSLLPERPPMLRGWEIAVYWHPAQAVGGDFYDLLALPDGRLAVAIADVVDKGIPAALVMANTRSILRGLARWGGPPGEALARANQLLSPEVPPGIFVTCLYGLLDTHNGALHYANAGHNPPYLRGRQGAVELWATGMALGLVPGTGYEEHKTTIGRGELLLLYSDGLSEAHSVSGEMFGDQRIQNILNREHHSAQGLIDALLSDLASFTGRDWVQEDDVTLMVLRRLRESEASP